MPGHPRTYGEDSPKNSVSGIVYGTPPHLRGRRVFDLVLQLLLGDTPAPTGKTHHGCRNVLHPTGHPRTYGEDRSAVGGTAALGGTPPHLRGRRHLHPAHHGRQGDTPAPTGKTSPTSPR